MATPENGTKYRLDELERRAGEMSEEVKLVRGRTHELANELQKHQDYDRRLARLEGRTENLNVTELRVENMGASVDKLGARFDDVIKALYVGLIGFGASCAAAGLFVFLAFR